MKKLTIIEAANIAGVHFNTIRNAIKTGKLKAENTIQGGRAIFLITEADLQAYIQGRQK